jgi:YD repeat-containing protein
MTYNAKGLLASETRGAVTTGYDYDDVLRLDSIADGLAGTSADVTTGLAYNPADQIVTRTRTNDAYAFGGYVNLSRSYTKNGLNQYTAAGGGDVRLRCERQPDVGRDADLHVRCREPAADGEAGDDDEGGAGLRSAGAALSDVGQRGDDDALPV